jgi:hypothetical protein
MRNTLPFPLSRRNFNSATLFAVKLDNPNVFLPNFIKFCEYLSTLHNISHAFSKLFTLISGALPTFIHS